MSPSARPSIVLGLTLGLLPAALDGAGKPPPPPTPCTACEIVYVQDGNGRNEQKDLMLMKKDGSSKTLLLAGASHVQHRTPKWAPDGVWIAFYTNTTTGNTLRLIRNNGTGLMTVATRCSAYHEPPAWRPVISQGGYWLVYSDTRRADGTCIVDGPPGYTTPGRNLWAVHVSLGSPVLVGDPLCLTCGLTEGDGDFWADPAWSRDGYHLSVLQVARAIGSVSHHLFVFDVMYMTGAPVLADPWPFPGYGPAWSPAFSSWAHLSDSVVMRTSDVDGTYGLRRYEIGLGSEPESLLSSTPITQGNALPFFMPRWSGDDTQLVDAITGTGSAKTDGIYVITLSPFSLKQIASSGSNAVSHPDWKP